MPRYAAFLRGVMPGNVRMPELVQAFEAAGFTGVRTVLGSGNVVFEAPPAPAAELERRAEAAMARRLARPFPAMVRPVDDLRALLDGDTWAGLPVPAGARRVVSFLRAPPRPAPRLPVEQEGARVLRLRGTLALTAYVRVPGKPVFMALIEQTLGKDVTTRTWETLEKVVAAGEAPPAKPRGLAAPPRASRARSG